MPCFRCCAADFRMIDEFTRQRHYADDAASASRADADADARRPLRQRRLSAAAIDFRCRYADYAVALITLSVDRC